VKVFLALMADGRLAGRRPSALRPHVWAGSAAPCPTEADPGATTDTLAPAVLAVTRKTAPQPAMASAVIIQRPISLREGQHDRFMVCSMKTRGVR